MTSEAILQAINTQEQQYILGQNLKIRRYLYGKHRVLNRKDFTFKNETFQTAKILLQTVKSIVDFHTSYLVGNPITLVGAETVSTVFHRIYNRGHYSLIDYQLVDDIVQYGNAFEYVYKDGNCIKSKVFDPLASYPIYDDNGNYTAFIEQWRDTQSDTSHYAVYEPETVAEYKQDSMGNLQAIKCYRNLSGLPIHYKSGILSQYDNFGVGIVTDLIPIMDEIESLLSKTADAVSTLSLNPLGVSAGQKISSAIDRDLTGVILNLEDGGQFEYASAMIDSQTVSLLLNELINQLYSVAQVPSVVFNGNVSNVSETSLKLLFTQLDNKSKRTATFFKQGLYQRFSFMRGLLSETFSDDDFASLDVSFNFNRPVDSSAIVDDLCKQKEAGALSVKSFIELSPYTNNAEFEVQRIANETPI